MSSMIELMMLEKLFKSDNAIEQLKSLEKYLKEKEDEKKKIEDEKKKKEKPKPPTFSVFQVMLFLTGIGPFAGIYASKLQIELLQSLMDAIRTLH